MRNFKLIEFYEDQRVELYDLSEDIGEKQDLSEAKPELAQELRQRLESWRQTLGAKMPFENPNYDPSTSQ
jgi:hypothetical protein